MNKIFYKLAAGFIMIVSNTSLFAGDFESVVDCIGYYQVGGEMQFDNGDKKSAIKYYNVADAFANAAEKIGASTELSKSLAIRKLSYEKSKRLSKAGAGKEIREIAAACNILLENNKIVQQEVAKKIGN